MRKYSNSQLMDATPQQASEWVNKNVRIVSDTGKVIEGMVIHIDREARPLNCPIPEEDHKPCGLKIDNGESIALGHIVSMEVEE